MVEETVEGCCIRDVQGIASVNATRSSFYEQGSFGASKAKP
jgi:hypothetical protein